MPNCTSLVVGTLGILPLAAFGQALDPVQPVDWSKFTPADFSDAEVDILGNYGPSHSFDYYVQNFHKLANAVRDQDPNRGLIDIHVWRAEVLPYSSRIMENVLSLSWFYTTDRPWNPYYNDPATRARLEAALTHWVSIADVTIENGIVTGGTGRFAETAPTNYKLAPTAFATRFLGEALRMLNNGPAIDSTVLANATTVHRMAVMSTFNSNPEYNNGIKFSNQYANLWAGALSYLAVHNDTAMANKLVERIKQASDVKLTNNKAHQSPAGYFYEEGGPDFSYNLNTHTSTVDAAWHYVAARDTQLKRDVADALIADHTRFMEWLSYNAVLQPGGEYFVINDGVSARQDQNVLYRMESPLAEVVPLGRAFSLTVEERAARIAQERQTIAARWGNAPDLQLGFTGYSPYAFMHRDHIKWYPTEAQRAEAQQQLPYLARDRFIHQRADDKEDVKQVFTYVRRPTYYAAFNAGEIMRKQRMGLGLLWHPQAGALLQSQTGDALGDQTPHAWGTRSGTTPGTPYEGHGNNYTENAVFSVNGTPVAFAAGNRDLPDGVLQVSYPIGGGTKQLTFNDDNIAVSVLHTGTFIEQIPLLVERAQDLQIDGLNGVSLLRDGQTVMSITFGPGSTINQILTDSTGNIRVGDLRVISLHVYAQNRLDYRIQMVPEPAAVGALGGATSFLLSRRRRAAEAISD